MMIHIALCDDNSDDILNMTRLVDEYKIEKTLNCDYKTFENGLDLIATLELGNHFDIYCLDIVMPKLTGIDVAKEIRNFDKNAVIIFFTSSVEFALAGYSVSAVDYIVKPITKEKFFPSFDKVIERLEMSREEIVIINSNNSLQSILLSNLVYVETNNRLVIYHLITGRTIESTQAFNECCDELLNYSYFIKPHRSYMVNMNYISSIQNEILLHNQVKISIPKGQVKEIKARYLDYQMEG